MSNNLWPDFNVSKEPRSPKAVVQESGTGLRDKTSGKIDFIQTRGTSITGGRVDVSYGLYAPALAYTYPFMRILFGIAEPYPVTIVVDGIDEMQAKDEKELIGVLGQIFNEHRTIATITRLMQLSSE